MRKEVELTLGVEIELKLPVPFSADQMRDVLDQHFGSGGERTRELTVMYDNSSTLTARQITFNLSRVDKVDVLLIPEQEVELEINEMSEFIRIFEAIGYRVSLKDDNITLILDESLPEEIMTSEQDSRLRLRRKKSISGEKAEISYKRPLQRSGTKKEIEFETQISDFEVAETLLSILGFHQRTSYERFRTTWVIEIESKKVKLELDEFSFGTYLEIEGPSDLLVSKAAKKIGLDTKSHIGNSYDGIYQQIMREKGLEPNPHIKF